MDSILKNFEFTGRISRIIGDLKKLDNELHAQSVEGVLEEIHDESYKQLAQEYNDFTPMTEEDDWMDPLRKDIRKVICRYRDAKFGPLSSVDNCKYHTQISEFVTNSVDPQIDIMSIQLMFKLINQFCSIPHTDTMAEYAEYLLTKASSLDEECCWGYTCETGSAPSNIYRKLYQYVTKVAAEHTLLPAKSPKESSTQ